MMNSWELRRQTRQLVAEEEGTLRQGARLNVALCYPAPYSVAMSSLGLQTIYREINAHAEAAAERAFLPDNPQAYRHNRLPVFTCESERPLADFPVIAFSIAWELELTGIFTMLDLGGIPLLRAQRNERHPFILAGGPLTGSNPALLFPFADAVIIGEGEDIIHQFLDIVMDAPRRDWPGRLAGLPGCYVPGLSPEIPAPARVPAERLPARSQIITKNTVLSSMFLIEPERGCSRSCAYCIMRGATAGGMRTVPPEKVLELIPAHARRVGLVGAAVTDHPRLKELLRALVADGRQIGISSLRADRLDEELVGLLAAAGYRTLTTAADGASQRLRDLADRHTEERHILRAAELGRAAGMARLKLYEMIGFPGESDDDIGELIRLAREISKIVNLSLTVSPFVAKRHTPLAGAPFAEVALLEARLTRIRAGLKGQAEVKPGSSRFAWIEYMLSQGGETAGLAALEAWRQGERFAAWKRAFANLSDSGF